MAIFHIQNKTAKKIPPIGVGLEKDIQTLFENNLEEILNIRFLASEYSTSFGGRIDSLGIDSDGSPVIVEYKKGQNNNVINQGLSYLGGLLLAGGFAFAATAPALASASPLIVAVSPSSGILEGDPVMITLVGGTAGAAATIADIRSATLTAPGPNSAGGKKTVALRFAAYQGNPVAFYGTGIDQTTGTAVIAVTLKSGAELSGSFAIGARVNPTESLPLPAQLGGNGIASQKHLVSDLDIDNAVLAKIRSNPAKSFWTAPFAWPIHAADVAGGLVVTDPFGYERDSGVETIIHKGVDFKAPLGTPIYAVNAGVVRAARLFSVYGNTVIIDHGMGIESFYMHLTQTSVEPGQAVAQGQLIGYSGETGYSEGPHLHLTIRIGGVSIDPIKFYALFGLTP